MLKTPFGVYAVEPTASCRYPPHKPVEARRERPREMHHRTTEEAARAPELERRLCRRRRDTNRLETRRLGEDPAAGDAAAPRWRRPASGGGGAVAALRRRGVDARAGGQMQTPSTYT
jgi:hypothetical protein